MRETNNKRVLWDTLLTGEERESSAASGGTYQQKTVTPAEETQNISPDSGYDGLSEVYVEGIPSEYIIPSGTESIYSNSTVFVKYREKADVKTRPSLGTLSISRNGVYDVSGYESAFVSVPQYDWGDALVERTISEFTDDTIQTVGEFAFCKCDLLETVSAKATKIASKAFQSCTGLVSVCMPEASEIGGGAFYGCSSLKEANFPKAETINTYAFKYCTALKSANFPKVSVINSDAFGGDTALCTISFPKATNIWNSAFSNCTALTDVYFPSATIVGSYAFDNCTSLRTANFPVAETISEWAFQSCISLTTISFPNVTSIGTRAFNNCRSIENASFSKAETLGSYAFHGNIALKTVNFPLLSNIKSNTFLACNSLEKADFPLVSDIAEGAFEYCYQLNEASFPAATAIGKLAFASCIKLLSFYLLGSSNCALANSNAFTGTPIAGYTTYTSGVYGSIYVRQSLYDGYISSANWSYYSSRFVSLTDAEIEALDQG